MNFYGLRSWVSVSGDCQATATGPDSTAEEDLPSERSGASAVLVGDSLYLLAGYSGQGRLEDMHRLDLKTKRWSRVEMRGEERPAARENNSAVLHVDSATGRRCILLYGGYSGSAWLADFWCFELDTLMGDSGTWTKVEAAGEDTAVPCGRFGFVAGILGSKLYLGFGYTGQQWLSDMHEFCLSTRTWKLCNFGGGASLPSRRSCPSWSEYNGSFWLFAGFNGVDRLNDFWKFEPETSDDSLPRWTLVRATGGGSPPSPRYFHASAVFRDSLFICSGFSGQERLNDLHVFDFNRLTWTQVFTDATPPGRSSLVAAVHDRKLLLGFGYNGQQVLNDMYEYELDPVEIPASSFRTDVRKMREDPLLTDVQFRVGGQTFRANRSLLAARSAHFRAMLFSSGMRETRADATTALALEDVDAETFSTVLDFIYTDELNISCASEEAVKVLIAAEMFMLDRLKGLCEDWLRRRLTVENVVNTLLTANKHNANGLKTLCLEFIVLHEDKLKTALKPLIHEPALMYEILLRHRPVEAATPQPPPRVQSSQAAGPRLPRNNTNSNNAH